MIKVEAGIGCTNTIELEGRVSEILADTLMIISMIYKFLNTQGKGAGEAFKDSITESIKDGIPFKSTTELVEHVFKKMMDSIKSDIREADN